MTRSHANGRIVSVVILLALGIMAGCDKEPSTTPTEDPIDYLLADALVRASTNQEGTRTETLYKLMGNDRDAVPDSVMTVEWYGPLGDMMALVSEYYGYRLAVYDPAPPAPVIVGLTGEYSLDRLVEEADEVAGSNAMISIDHESRFITIRYRH